MKITRYCKCYASSVKYKTFNSKFKRLCIGALLKSAKLFCERHNILMSNINAPYVDILLLRHVQGKQNHTVAMKHHFHMEILSAAVKKQLEESNSIFSERII